MDATTELVVSVDGTGRSCIGRLRCEVPLVFREALDDGDTLDLSWVNAAAGPVGGDHLQLHLHVTHGASVRIRSTGASLVHPGPTGAPSTFDITVTLADGAMLDWAPEPTVSVRGSSHRTSMRVVAHPGSSARLVERVVLGRHGEPPGRLSMHQRIETGGHVTLDHELVLGDRVLHGPGAHGEFRALMSAATLGTAVRPEPFVIVEPHLVAARFALDHGATLTTAAADDLRAFGGVVPTAHHWTPMV
jgi:urease accessory protein